MSLILVATPIGNANDISLRGLEVLRRVPVIILEEYKESTAFLRQHGITSQTTRYETLNEHSTSEDLQKLLELCRQLDVALITDCGTPGFADPGADLVRLCRQAKVPVTAAPGPSSLMTLLSLSSQQLRTFYFRGFLPQETSAREQAWLALKQKGTEAVVLMDTPYRLQKMLDELVQYFPGRRVLLALNLTQENEQILEGKPEEVRAQVRDKKAEFMLLLYP
jgi:16S rRNA (cytidine1402-2'-O)-methyltransferase